MHCAGIAFETHEVRLRDKPAELLRLSPKATVPVLLLPGGEVLEQSVDIIFWALAQADPQGWRRAELDAESMPWLALNDGPFKRLLDRYKYPERYPEATRPQWRAEAETLMLAPLQQRLTDQSYLLGQAPSWLNLALLPFIRQFAAVDAAWFETAPYPALRAWLQAWLATPMFMAVMSRQAAVPSSPCAAKLSADATGQ